jgi:hypothetical protein
MHIQEVARHRKSQSTSKINLILYPASVSVPLELELRNCNQLEIHNNMYLINKAKASQPECVDAYSGRSGRGQAAHPLHHCTTAPLSHCTTVVDTTPSTLISLRNFWNDGGTPKHPTLFTVLSFFHLLGSHQLTTLPQTSLGYQAAHSCVHPLSQLVCIQSPVFIPPTPPRPAPSTR